MEQIFPILPAVAMGSVVFLALIVIGAVLWMSAYHRRADAALFADIADRLMARNLADLKPPAPEPSPPERKPAPGDPWRNRVADIGFDLSKADDVASWNKHFRPAFQQFNESLNKAMGLGIEKPAAASDEAASERPGSPPEAP